MGRQTATRARETARDGVRHVDGGDSVPVTASRVTGRSDH
ncbi:hypothetical protein FHS38_002426 [Streptomyces netropsis]|uniref:Uncharacterized protein n=1 Tax=Streptomyces netropsis TaxID=55404 RepID=A0A7W7LB63_STRNE|nr:hypothetical protein [Streptomyces netropsis]